MNPELLAMIRRGIIDNGETASFRTTGSGSSSGGAKPTDVYALSNIDDSTTTEYYGYEDADGNWYIKKLDTSNAITFAAGTSNYATAWTNRASQTYASYKDTF